MCRQAGSDRFGVCKMFVVRINRQEITLARIDITVVRNRMLTISLQFAQNKLQFDPTWNVGFGPSKPGKLIGQLE